VGGKTPEENELFADEVERLTGIEQVEWIKPPADYYERLQASLAAGEQFDLIYMTKEFMNVLVEQRALTPLTDRIESSAVLSNPTVVPPEEWELVRAEAGEIYVVYNSGVSGTMPVVRADWLEKLGLEVPRTLDDFYRVLRAFTEQDPDGDGRDDTYGLSTAGLYDLKGFMNAAGVKAGYVIDESGKRTIPYATEAAIPVYEWFARLYREGILDPNFATNETSDMRDLFLTDRVGIVTYWDAWVGQANNIRQAEPGTDFRARGIPGAVGPDVKVMLRRGDPSLWGIPVNAPNPDLAFRFLEFWNCEPGNILGSLGIEGHDYIVTEDGEYQLTEIGREHNTDHGAPIPQNRNWENPVGLLPGVAEAQQVLLTSEATIERLPPEWADAEPIVEHYTYQAILGRMPVAEAVERMQDELRAAGLID